MHRGVIYGLSSAVLFGVSTPLAKMLVGTVSPWMLAGLLYAGSGLGLLAVLAGRAVLASRSVSMGMPRGTEWLWLAGATAFGGVAAPVALMYGLAQTTASTASLLLNLEGVFTALLAWFVFRENFDRRIVLGMLAIVAGGAVLAWTPDGLAAISIGPLFVAAACLCWAIDNNLTRKTSASDAVVIAGTKGLVAGSVNLGLALALGQPLPDAPIVLASATLGFAGYGVSLVLFVLALRHLGTARAGAYFSVAPFFGAALALVLQPQDASWQLVAAAALMGAGVWLHVTERHGHLHVHEPLEHSHWHVHDEHHQHDHEPSEGDEPHAHRHVHRPLIHSHPHYPDVHHRHRHSDV